MSEIFFIEDDFCILLPPWYTIPLYITVVSRAKVRYFRTRVIKDAIRTRKIKHQGEKGA
jgi:hypothetical protein